MVEVKLLDDLEVAVAPSEGDVGRSGERSLVGGNFVQAGVRGGLQLRVVENQGEWPAVGERGRSFVHQVQSAGRLGVIFILLELPAFHYRAAIGEFHAIERIFHHDGAFLRVGYCRRAGFCGWLGRRGRGAYGSIRCWSGGRTRSRGRCGCRVILLRRMGRRLGREELGPQQDHYHGKERGDQDAQLWSEFVFARSAGRKWIWRRAHERAPRASQGVQESDGISSRFSGTGSYPNFRDRGWQRNRRFVPSHAPRATPNRAMAS